MATGAERKAFAAEVGRISQKLNIQSNKENQSNFDQRWLIDLAEKSGLTKQTAYNWWSVFCKSAGLDMTPKQAIAEQPTATQQQIAEKVGLKSQGYVSEIIAEISAKSEPKLLKHGGKVTEQVGNNQVASKGGMTAPYILARLKRDGFEDLAQQVKAGAHRD